MSPPPPQPSPKIRGKTAALHTVAQRLEGLGTPFALGGSGLLAHLGLAEDVRDWDLTTDAPAAMVAGALGGLEREEVGPNGVYRTERMFRVSAEGMRVDVICGFAIEAPSGICHIPTLAVGTGFGVPAGSPEAWLIAYALLGRPEKALLLERHLAERGTDPAVTEWLLRQPLPDEVAARLRRLRDGDEGQKSKTPPEALWGRFAKGRKK